MIVRGIYFAPREAALVAELLANEIAADEAVLTKWYGDDRPKWARKTLSVIRVRVRRKLRQVNIEVSTARGVGCYLSSGDRLWLRGL